MQVAVGSIDGARAWTCWDSREGHQVAAHALAGHKADARDAWVEAGVGVEIAFGEGDSTDAVVAVADNRSLELAGGGNHLVEVLVVVDVVSRSALQACLTEKISARMKTLFVSVPP